MSLPTGTVTFLFTDIEGSTKLWESHPIPMKVAQARHDAIVRSAVLKNEGQIFKTMGDAFCAAFHTAPEAVKATLDAQLALAAEEWPEPVTIRVRMAVHTGAAEVRDNDYFGMPLTRVARLLSAGHGGQVLLSQATHDLVRDDPPKGLLVRDLGENRLKDLIRPERIFQAVSESLRQDFPPLRTLDAHPNNLPVQLTSFVGREREMEEIKDALTSSRLVTLTGAGGCGKTRLSLQVGADLVDRFMDGVWLVELAPLSDPRLVPYAVASVLGVKEEAGRTISETLTTFLKEKEMLILLDNCEHLIEAAAILCQTLLSSSSKLVILASSREGLRIPGETAYRVPSLSVPNPAKRQTLESLAIYETVRLFIDRATAVDRSFKVTNESAAALAAVCHRLGGIPLAIELAAARTRSMSLEVVNQRLDQRFRLLTGGSRTALPRQQTLRSLIDWSYDLLTDAEKSTLNRVSVFAEGWTVAAAEKVCAGGIVEEWQVLDLLTSLVDKSLAISEHHPDGERYRVLETVRQYGKDRLTEIGELQELRNRHFEFFLALAEEAAPNLQGPDQGMWLARLESEHDNLRAALEWSSESTALAGEPALRLCGALWRFWIVRGYLVEGRGRCGDALSTETAQAPTATRANVLNGAGLLDLVQGQYPPARALFEEALELNRRLGNGVQEASNLSNLGIVVEHQGDFVTARGLYEQALALNRKLGNRSAEAANLNNLGISAEYHGDFALAQTLYQQALALSQELGNRGWEAVNLGNLGNVAAYLGSFDSAKMLCEQALALNRDLGNRVAEAANLENLAFVALKQNDYGTSRTLLEQALTLNRDHGIGPSVAVCLEGMARLAATMGEGRRAARLWGAADILRSTLGGPIRPCDRERYESEVASVKEAVGEETFDAEWSKGAKMTMAQACAFAFEPPAGLSA